MKKMYKSLKPIAALLLILAITISCDSDFTNIESDVQGIKNFEATSKLFPFTATTTNYTPYNASGTNDPIGVQTSNLNGVLFGIYKNPTETFGSLEASIATQVTPTTYNKEFGTNPTFESIWLNIPYFSSLQSTDSEGNNTYKLDSVFGNEDTSFKLSIYRNNYILRDLDPASDFENSQCYYSNQADLIESGSTELIYQDNDFEISDVEHRDYDSSGEVTARHAPGLRVNLLNLDPNDGNTQFWQEIFFDNENTGVLSTESNFKDFFRGLIIKVEANDPNEPDGSLTPLNFNSANILVEYTNDEEIASEEELSSADATVYRLEFDGNTVNTFNVVNNTNNDGDQDNLYLQGAEGSMAVLDLFSGDIENEDGDLVPSLDYFTSKKDKWLINEANLIFYVNQGLITSGDSEPNRVTLYDLKNNEPIIDYFLDGSTNTANPTQSKIGYSEVLTRDESNNGVRYKIRLSQHITNILERDSTNVKLGLFIANNVNNTTVSKIQGKNEDDDDQTLDIIPTTSILTPRATILHGCDNDPSVALRAEFEIFYTEPEN